IAASEAASALVTAEAPDGHTITGVVTAMNAVTLVGGSTASRTVERGVAPISLEAVGIFWHEDAPSSATISISSAGVKIVDELSHDSTDEIVLPFRVSPVDKDGSPIADAPPV